MAKNFKSKEKIAELMLTIPEDTYLKFKNKAYSEGYSIREALRLLIISYLSEEIKPNTARIA